MNINRYNYEEFFMLYTDNELSVQDRRAVEKFISENPDLSKELEHLQQSVFRPDVDVVYKNKSSLMHPEANEHSIHAGNYEEAFLLYADNELSFTEKAAVDKFVSDHPQFKAEFELIQTTKLTPREDEVFLNKESLYRYKNTYKGGGFRWWRVAAAAALVAITASVWMYNQRSTDTGYITKQETKTSKKRALDNPTPGPVTSPESGKATDSPAHELTAASQQNTARNNNAIKQDGGLVRNQAKGVSGLQKRSKPFDLKREIDDNTNMAHRGAAVEKVPNKSSGEVNPQLLESLIPPMTTEAIADASIITPDEETPGTVPVTKTLANNVLYAAESSETVILTNIPLNRKHSLRGLFRKASRMLDKTTALRSGEKKGILIGNFEIAIQ